MGGGGKTWPASPVHFECSTPQPLSCRRSSPITCRDCGAITVEIFKSNQELSRWLRAPTWPHGDDIRDRINQPGLAPALHTLAGSHRSKKGRPPLADRSPLSISSCENALQQVRTTSHLLHPPLLEELGLESALRWYLEGLEKHSGIKTSLEIQPPHLPRFAPELENAVYRVVQEALTNVFRHSGPARPVSS